MKFRVSKTMRKVLNQKFFNRPTATVAKELLGKFLVRRHRHYSLIRANGRVVEKYKTVALMITETEAYDGFKDKASHAHRGETARNKIMFGEAGHIYVYFTYGMHWMLNIVTGKKGYPAAVLIRGLKHSSAMFARSTLLWRADLGELNGPAKLTKALKIDKRLNGKPLSKKSGLWIENRGVRVVPKDILQTRRVGVSYAGEWADKKLRFVLKEKKKIT